MSEQNTSQIITAVHDWCQTRPIRLCVLFGSQATGQTHPGSDVDLAIWLADSSDSAESPDSGTKLGWLVELQNLLDKEVSLALVSSNLDPVLGMEIVQDGRVIFSAEANLWHKECVRLWHAYNDSLPFRRAAREQMRHFARGLTHDQ